MMGTTKRARTRIGRVATGAFVGSLLVAGCGGGYDREATIDQIVEQNGLDRETATCLVDGLEARLGTDRLGEGVSELTAEDQQVMVEVVTECTPIG